MSGGRPCSSVHVISQRIFMVLGTKTITELARMTGRDRSGMSKSINRGWMDKDMLDAIGKALNVAPGYLRGDIDEDKPYLYERLIGLNDLEVMYLKNEIEKREDKRI